MSHYYLYWVLKRCAVPAKILRTIDAIPVGQGIAESAIDRLEALEARIMYYIGRTSREFRVTRLGERKAAWTTDDQLCASLP